MKKDVNEVKLKKSQAGEEEFLWAADTLEEAKDGGMRAQRMEDEGVVLSTWAPPAAHCSWVMLCYFVKANVGGTLEGEGRAHVSETDSQAMSLHPSVPVVGT